MVGFCGSCTGPVTL